MSQHVSQKVQGFTLLEVMIALTIFALIAVTFQKSVSQSVDQFNRIRSHTFANWIAENKLAQLRLAGVLPRAKEYKEDIKYANSEWKLKTQVSKTNDPDLMKVDITVIEKIKDTDKEVQAGVFSGIVGKY